MSAIKNLMRSFIIGLISSSMIFSSVATATVPQQPDVDLNLEVNFLNQSKGTYNELIATFKKADPKKAKELESFFSTHSSYKNAKLPKAVVENDKIAFMIDGEKVLYSIDKNGVTTILAGDKKVQLDYSMTIDQVVKKITDVLGEKKFSLINLIINDAHAMLTQGIVLAVLCFLFAYAVHSTQLADNFEAYIKSSKEWCAKLDEVAPTEDLVAVYRKLYNKLSDDYVEICLPGKFVLNSKGFSYGACRDLPEVKKCVKKKLDQFNSKTVNDSSRAQVKEMHYEEKLDRYVPTATSK